MAGNKKITIGITGGIILVISIAVLVFQFSAPQKATGEKVRIVIGLYDTTAPIKDAEEAFRMSLYEKGLIRNPFAFSIALRLKGMHLKDIEPGGYYIEKGLNVFELVKAFKEPDEEVLQKVELIPPEVDLIPPDFFIPSFNEEGEIEFKAQEDQIELLDERLGYEMKYPSTWSITEERKDFGIELSRMVFQSKDYEEKESEEYKGVVARGEETGLLPEMVMTEGVELSLIITEIPSGFEWQDWAERATDYPYGKIVSEKFLTLEGKEIYERQTESGEITSIIISFPGPEEAKLFELILHTLKKDEGKNLETLNQILSTFRFLE